MRRNWNCVSTTTTHTRKHMRNGTGGSVRIPVRAQHPRFAAYMRRGGYRMPIITDQEWLSKTWFHTRQDGGLDARYASCETRYTPEELTI